MTPLTKINYEEMYFQTETQMVNSGWIEACLGGFICMKSVSAFWDLLVIKHLWPTSFEASIPEIERCYQKTRNFFELMNSIFHGAISAEKVPVCLSEEELRQIHSFNRIPLIFASTQNLQSHVDPDYRIDFNRMNHQEISLLGPLTLGKEINIVMTDPAHASDVKKFLLQHRIQGVSVFSITRKSVCEDPQLRPVSLEESATAAPEAAVPESGEVRGKKRQAESKLSVEPATKQSRSVSQNEEALSSLIAIHEMLLQDGQVAEAQKIAEQIAALV